MPTNTDDKTIIGENAAIAHKLEHALEQRAAEIQNRADKTHYADVPPNMRVALDAELRASGRELGAATLADFRRHQATALARRTALRHGQMPGSPGYLPTTGQQAEDWQPHEWAIDAIAEALDFVAEEGDDQAESPAGLEPGAINIVESIRRNQAIDPVMSTTLAAEHHAALAVVLSGNDDGDYDPTTEEIANITRATYEAVAEDTRQFFAYAHLPPHLADISRRFALLAESLKSLPVNRQSVRALDKLLEAKDCAVRSLIAKT